jgi:hypothetical protein
MELILTEIKKSGLNMEKITIDEVEYDISNPSEDVKHQLLNIKFVDEQILQKNNELQVADTARMAYLSAFKVELEKLTK